MADPGVPPQAEDDDLPDDARAPLWARLVGFAVVVACLVSLVGIVVARDRHRDELAGRSGTTARTVALPPDNGGSLVTTTEVATPGGSGPTTLPRRPRSNDEVALALESVLKRDSGWTHKVSCRPGGQVRKGDVLECFAASEPPIKEAPPSTVLAVVIDDDGRFVYGAREGDSYTLASLTDDPGLGCDALVQRGYPYAVALAYWEANNRPATLDPGGSGRPCTDRYSASDVDATFARAR